MQAVDCGVASLSVWDRLDGTVSEDPEFPSPRWLVRAVSHRQIQQSDPSVKLVMSLLVSQL